MHRVNRSDGEVTKQKILHTAAELIAQHGFAKTTSKAIAQAAEVDLASINYHFKGRDGLYQAVLVEAHQQYLDEQYLIELTASALPAEDKLHDFFKTLTEKLLSDNSCYSQVLMREMLTSSAQLSQFMEHSGTRKFLLLRQIISDAAGLPIDHPQLLPCVLSVMAPCFMLIFAGSNASSPLHRVAHMDADALAMHLKVFSLAGLKAVHEQISIQPQDAL